MKHLTSLQTKSQIDRLCEQFGIENYIINDDMTIDVDGDVKFQGNLTITRFPITFNKVKGDFYCETNKLSTLAGSPREVGGSFVCYANSITSLIGGPVKVGKDYDCSHQILKSLEGSPDEIPGNFSCGFNMLPNLDHLPKIIGGDFWFCCNPFTDDLLEFMNIDENDIFIAYQKYYDIWNPEFDPQTFRTLLEDIKDGLQ